MPPISQFKPFHVLDVGNAVTDVYEAPVGKDSYALQLDISCKGNTGVQVNVFYFDGSTAYSIGSNLPIPVGATLEIIESKKIVIAATHKLQVECLTSGETVDVVGSVVEDVNS